jgi:hypothetical protein
MADLPRQSAIVRGGPATVLAIDTQLVTHAPRSGEAG